jgi:pimeloyl-ACP methyl ester carboxylesterase
MQAGVSEALHLPGAEANTPKPLLNCGLWLIDMGLWLLNWFAKRFPAPFARMVITAASDLPPDEIALKANQIAADPRQMNHLHKLVNNLVPLGMRQTGLRNDLEQLARLPRYPLEHIHAQTLVIHGRFDTAVPYSQAQFVTETVPNADLITLETSGHLIWLGDEWKDVEPRLVKFLKDNAPK